MGVPVGRQKARRNVETKKMSVIQINLGKGKEATALLNRRALKQGTDVVMVQEPHKNTTTIEGYTQYKQNKEAKTEIWIRNGISGTLLLTHLTNENTTTVKVRGVVISCIYDEPGGKSNKRLREIEGSWKGEKGGLLIAGDLNAKNTAWGDDETDARGTELMDFIVENQLQLANRRNSPATFQNSRGGRSWIDVTLYRGVGVEKWNVEIEETLSDHRYISYELRLDKPQARRRTEFKYDFINTNWSDFRRQLEGLAGSDHLRLDTVEELENTAQRLQDICKKTCRTQIRTRRQPMDELENWWTEDLEEQRKRLRELLVAISKTTNANTEIRLRAELANMRREYKSSIELRKEEHAREVWKQQLEREPWYGIWNILGKDKSEKGRKNIKTDEGRFTTSIKETTEALVKKYFPKDNKDLDTIQQRQIRHREVRFQNVEEVCLDIEGAMATLQRGKACGIDGIPNEALRWIVEAIGDRIGSVVEGCVQMGYFPEAWKTAKVIWLPKSNGEMRPISVLPAMGRLFDKAISIWMQSWLEENNVLSETQYGFRRNRSTIMALKKLTERITLNKKDKIHTLVIALDLRNAFNTAWPPYMDKQMEELGLPKSIIQLCGSFTRDRDIVSGEVRTRIDMGCPQGSSLGPTLWLMVMEGWFGKLKEANDRWKLEMGQEDLVEAQAYADDAILILAGRSARAIERKWEIVWEACKIWERESGVRYNDNKTEAMFITAGGNIRPPTIKIDGTAVHMRDSIHYLGLTIDKKLNFIEHLKGVRAKVDQTTVKILGIVRRRWGNKVNIVRDIYNRAVRPAITYGWEIWGERARDSRIQKQLSAIQRGYVLAITGAYRTAPTAALCVLAGIPPLHLEINEWWRLNGSGERGAMVDDRVLARWQEEWNETSTGRSVYDMCRMVGKERLDLTRKAVQVVTGHGNMAHYLQRFGLRDCGMCECGLGEEDRNHILWECTRPDRIEARISIGERFGGLDVELRRNWETVETDVEKLNAWAQTVIDDEWEEE